MSTPIKWKPVTRERYWEMLEILPPATQTPLGFLVGEPWKHRACTVSRRDDQPAFAAFAGINDKYYEAVDAMTIAEFKRLLGSHVLDNIQEEQKTPSLLEALNEARSLMPLGTAKRANWLTRAGAAIAAHEQQQNELLEALKTTANALKEIQAARELGAEWFTNRQSGQYAHISMWLKRGQDAARPFLPKAEDRQMADQMTFVEEDNGNCRVYYRHEKRLYCWQIDDYRAGTFKFYRCSSDGEPSHEVEPPASTPLPPCEERIGQELKVFLIANQEGK